MRAACSLFVSLVFALLCIGDVDAALVAREARPATLRVDLRDEFRPKLTGGFFEKPLSVDGVSLHLSCQPRIDWALFGTMQIDTSSEYYYGQSKLVVEIIAKHDARGQKSRWISSPSGVDRDIWLAENSIGNVIESFGEMVRGFDAVSVRQTPTLFVSWFPERSILEELDEGVEFRLIGWNEGERQWSVLISSIVKAPDDDIRAFVKSCATLP